MGVLGLGGLGVWKAELRSRGYNLVFIFDGISSRLALVTKSDVLLLHLESLQLQASLLLVDC